MPRRPPPSTSLPPPLHRIAEMTAARGWTYDDLAAATGLSRSAAGRAARGARDVGLAELAVFARAFGVSMRDLIRDDDAPTPGLASSPQDMAAQGMAEDAHPLAPDDAMGRAASIGLAVISPAVVVVASRVMDDLGLAPGDVAVFEMDADAVAAVQSGEIVLVRVYDEAHAMRAETLIRQYVAPALLITNSRADNTASINMRSADAHIKGVYRGLFRPARRS